MIKVPHWPVPLGYKPIDLELERMKECLRRLGHPEEKLPPVIHVAGTNGKGSTIAFMRAIFEAAGYKAHVYTSPHLVEFNERIVLAGNYIDDGTLHSLLEECREASDGVNLTFFEGTTLAAFLAFSRVEADVVLLETGMGGRLDATNVIVKPALTVITPVSMDHREYLGDTLEKIAGEKAAIMKSGVVSVIGKQSQEVMSVMRGAANDIGASLLEYGQDWVVTDQHYSSGDKEIEFPQLPLKGEHQNYNAGAAVAAIQQIVSQYGKRFLISERDILSGLRNASWPGRLQNLKRGTLVDIANSSPVEADIFIDGGHNVDAARVLSDYIGSQDNGEAFLVIGMLKNRDIEEYLREFQGCVRACYAVPIPEADCHDTKDICSIAQKLGIDSVEKNSVVEAVRDIVERQEIRKPQKPFTDKGFSVYICGSLYLAGNVLESNGQTATNIKSNIGRTFR